MSGNLKPLTDSIKTDIPLLLYCKGGVRSVRAAVKLYNAGYRNLCSLKGGIDAWKKEGLPVVKKRSRRKKQIKAGSRKKKLELINKMNPEWADLSNFPDDS